MMVTQKGKKLVNGKHAKSSEINQHDMLTPKEYPVKQGTGIRKIKTFQAFSF